MKTSTLDTLIWVLVYGGLLVLCFGIAVQRSAGALGMSMIVGGAVIAVAGFGLIYVRSRMKGD